MEHEEIVFETIKNEVDFDDYYVLIIYDGGYEWHGYISMSNNQVTIEKLWNEDYSGIGELF